jgi:hypothetical protein
VAGLAAAPFVLADEAFVTSALECRAVESAEKRLACYDKVVDGHNARSAPVASANAGTTAAAAASTAPTAATKEAEDEFGLPPMAETDDKIDRIEAIVVKVSTSSSRKMTFELDNGQVWRQTTFSSLRVKDGDEVIIRRRSFGSHSLSMEGTSRSMKVKRVK